MFHEKEKLPRAQEKNPSKGLEGVAPKNLVSLYGCLPGTKELQFWLLGLQAGKKESSMASSTIRQ